MGNYKYHNKEVEFYKTTGVVLNQNKYSETRVSTTDGYVTSSGRVVSPTVHSESVTKHEIWIKTVDDREINIRLSGVNIPICEGQLISIVSAGRLNTKSNSNYYVSLINHSSKESSVINPTYNLLSDLKLAAYTPVLWTFWGTSLLFLIFQTNMLIAGVMIATVLGAIHALIIYILRKGVAKSFQAYREKIIKIIHQRIQAGDLTNGAIDVPGLYEEIEVKPEPAKSLETSSEIKAGTIPTPKTEPVKKEKKPSIKKKGLAQLLMFLPAPILGLHRFYLREHLKGIFLLISIPLIMFFTTLYTRSLGEEEHILFMKDILNPFSVLTPHILSDTNSLYTAFGILVILTPAILISLYEILRLTLMSKEKFQARYNPIKDSSDL